MEYDRCTFEISVSVFLIRVKSIHLSNSSSVMRHHYHLTGDDESAQYPKLEDQ
jgi:hypothetical protein